MRDPLVKLVLAGLAAAGVALAGGVHAHAYTDRSVADLERQIDDAWRRLEPVIEQHNEARRQLAANRARSAELTRQIEPLAAQVDLAMGRVGEIAVRAYKGGLASSFNSLLRSGSPTAFARQLSFLDLVARAERDQVRDVAALKEEYEARREPLDRLIAELARAEAELAARASRIDAEIKRLQGLRLAAYGSTGATGALRPVPCPLSYPGGRAGVAVNFACAQIGKPYVWAAAGPDGYDCSGLTMAAWAGAGVSLPHSSSAQRRQVPPVSRVDLRPGDLVFYYGDVHHVAIYAGGDWIVHAPQPGELVHMQRIDSAPIHSYGRPG